MSTSAPSPVFVEHHLMSWRADTKLSNLGSFSVSSYKWRVDHQQMTPLHASTGVIMKQGTNNTSEMRSKWPPWHFGIWEIIHRCCSLGLPLHW